MPIYGLGRRSQTSASEALVTRAFGVLEIIIRRQYKLLEAGPRLQRKLLESTLVASGTNIWQNFSAIGGRQELVC